VHKVRQARAPAGTTVLVGGSTAALVDAKHAISSRLPLAGAIIVVMTFLLLFLFTGSVVQPVRALLGPDRPEDQARRHRSRRSAAPFRHPAAQRRGAPDRPDLHPSRGPCQVPFGRALGGSARGYLAVDGAPQQSRYGLLDGRLFCISIHRHPWGECPHLPRTGSSAAGHGKDLGHATRSVGYRELRQPRTRADGESPSRRATLAFACPARIPAATRDLQFVELDRKGPAEQVNMACCARRCRLPTRRQGPGSGRRSLQRSGPVGAVDDHLAIGRHRRSSRP